MHCTRTNVELKSYNLNRFAKPTRCHPFNSFLQQSGVIICMVVILLACNTWVDTTQKMIMMKKLSRKSFVEAATCTAAKGTEESFKRCGKRRIHVHGIFCYRADCSTECLFIFFHVLLTWLNPFKLNTFSALCNESKKSLLK